MSQLRYYKMRLKFMTKCVRVFIKNVTLLLPMRNLLKMRQYKERLKDVLLDIKLKPLSNELSFLINKKGVVMVMHETSL